MLQRMKIIDIQWRTIACHSCTSFIPLMALWTTREGIIVQVTTNKGITGIGEIAPLPTFNGGSLTDAYSLLPILAGHLHHTTLYEALDLLAAEQVSTKAASTLCGLEIALLDALGKANGSQCLYTALTSRIHATSSRAS